MFVCVDAYYYCAHVSMCVGRCGSISVYLCLCMFVHERVNNPIHVAGDSGHQAPPLQWKVIHFFFQLIGNKGIFS